MNMPMGGPPLQGRFGGGDPAAGGGPLDQIIQLAQQVWQSLPPDQQAQIQWQDLVPMILQQMQQQGAPPPQGMPPGMPMQGVPNG